MDIIRFSNYSAYYKLKKNRYYIALKNLDFSVKEGEVLAVVGPSGCGKTTLLKSIMGSNKLVEGDIFFDGKNLDGVDIGKQNIAYVAQDYNLYPSMTVYENIAYPLQIIRTDPAEIDRRVRQIAAKLNVSFLLTRKPKQLSGGQHQRVSIARALVKNPRLILFDEPFSNLEPTLREEMREYVKSIHEEYGTTMIFVTHDLEEAFFLADRILVLNKGAVEQLGSAEEVRRHPRSMFVKEFVLL